jgi:hypothetical protein
LLNPERHAAVVALQMLLQPTLKPRRLLSPMSASPKRLLPHVVAQLLRLRSKPPTSKDHLRRQPRLCLEEKSRKLPPLLLPLSRAQQRRVPRRRRPRLPRQLNRHNRRTRADLRMRRRRAIASVRARSFPVLRVLAQSRLELRSSRHGPLHQQRPAQEPVFLVHAAMIAPVQVVVLPVEEAVVVAMIAHAAAAKASGDRSIRKQCRPASTARCRLSVRESCVAVDHAALTMEVAKRSRHSV